MKAVGLNSYFTALFISTFISSLYGAPPDGTMRKDKNSVPYSTATSASDGKVAVTGELVYPTPLTLFNLGFDSLLTSSDREIFRFERKDLKVTASSTAPKIFPELQDITGKKILVAAEGHGGLGPFFRRTQISPNAWSTDLWYGNSQHMTDAVGGILMNAWQQTNTGYFSTEDATKFAGIPSESVDLVLSHMFFDYLSRMGQAQALAAALRVLRPGGEIRYYFADRIAQNPVDRDYVFEYLRRQGYRFEHAIAESETSIHLTDLWGGGRGLPDGITLPVYGLPRHFFDQYIAGCWGQLCAPKEGHQFDHSLLVIKKLSGPTGTPSDLHLDCGRRLNTLGLKTF